MGRESKYDVSRVDFTGNPEFDMEMVPEAKGLYLYNRGNVEVVVGYVQNNEKPRSVPVDGAAYANLREYQDGRIEGVIFSARGKEMKKFSRAATSVTVQVPAVTVPPPPVHPIPETPPPPVHPIPETPPPPIRPATPRGERDKP